MSRTLILFGGASPEAPMAWSQLDAQGQVVDSGEPGAQGPPAASPAQTILVLPGAEGRLMRLDLPARTEAQARAAAALLIERDLAERQNDLHIAVGAAIARSDARLVAAVSRRRLTAWLERCRAMGADPHTIVLDCSVLPAEPGEAVAAEMGESVIVGAGASGGFSIERDLAPAVFARWAMQTQGAVTRLRAMGGDSAPWRQALAGAPVSVESAPPADTRSLLVQGAAEMPAEAPNLRQGEFAPAERNNPSWQPWRFAALLAVAAVLLQVGSLVSAGVRDRQAAARILAAAESDFRAARPGVERIVNLRAQVAAQVNAMQQGARHPVLVINTPVIEALRAQPQARLDEVRHQAPARAVTLRFSAPQPQPLEAVAAALRERGVALEARQLQPQAGRYAAELQAEASP